MLDPHLPARQANEMGAEYRLHCRYEWDRQHQQFRYRFYRRGKLIGSTGNPRQVIERMEAYIGGNTK